MSDKPPRDYETLTSHASDNEYLYYMHYRLGIANRNTERLITALWFTNILLAAIVVMLWRASGEWPF